MAAPVSIRALEKLRAARDHLARRETPRARRLLGDVLADDPAQSDAHHMLAIIALGESRIEEALGRARRALALQPGRADFHLTLGRALKAAGDVEAAESEYRAAISREPRLAEAHVSLGLLRKAQGDFDEAIACYRAALDLRPDMPEARANLAVALEGRRLAQGDRSSAPDEEALAEQQRAAELNPDHAPTQHNLGLMRMRAGEFDAALQPLNQALGLEPANETYCLDLARALLESGRTEGAIDCYEKWLSLNPPTAKVRAALAYACTMHALPERALEAGRAALEEAPEDKLALESLAIAKTQLLLHEEAYGHLRRLATLVDDDLNSSMLMLVNYLEEDPAPIARLHEAHGRRHGAAPRTARPAARSGDGRLRIGYVSGDLRRHSVAYFLEPILAAHDRRRVEVTCYCNNKASDAVTERLRGLSDRWVDCRRMEDDTLARRIAEDGIDVLVDLSGHTSDNRLGMFARHPARVQVGYLGYPTRTGLAAIDRRLTDAVIDPPQEPAPPTEIPLRLAASMFCYRPEEGVEPLAPGAGRRDAPVFGSFNNPQKIGPRTLELWSAVLHANPRSRLLLKASVLREPRQRDRVREAFARHGVAPERLDLVDWVSSVHGHLETYREVDVALDPFPYNGATTTCEALWMGVPVASRMGRSHAARAGASILSAAGFADCVARTDEAFVEIAGRLAERMLADPAERLRVRATLRDSRLMDAASFTRDLEDRYEEALA